MNLTQEFLDALRSGRTRLTVRLSADDANNEINIAKLAEAGTSSRLEIRTIRRPHLVFDIFDSDGRRYADGVTIYDARNLKAGDYLLRVYDPFADENHRLYDPEYRQTDPRSFIVQISPPKIGDSHTPTDRDEIFGNDGNDVITGNGYLDRLFGGKGVDFFTGEQLEVRDFGVVTGNLILDALIDVEGDPNPTDVDGTPSTFFAPAPGELSRNVASPLDFEVVFADDVTVQVIVGGTVVDISYLGLRIADALNLVKEGEAGTLLLLRPLMASDMTQLVELDLSSDPRAELAHLKIADLTGIDYAVNLEFLALGDNNVVLQAT